MNRRQAFEASLAMEEQVRRSVRTFPHKNMDQREWNDQLGDWEDATGFEPTMLAELRSGDEVVVYVRGAYRATLCVGVEQRSLWLAFATPGTIWSELSRGEPINISIKSVPRSGGKVFVARRPKA
jgi:hypothetical protein